MPSPRVTPFLFLSSFFLLLTSCFPVETKPTLPPTEYYLVTVEPRNSPTPFQPPTEILPTATQIPSPTFTFTPTATLTATPTPFPTVPTPVVSDTPTKIPSVDRTQYAISALLDYDHQTVTVAEDIRYTNTTGSNLPTLVLAVEPNLWTSAFALDNLTVNDSAADYSLDGQRLEVTLDQTLKQGETIKIGIAYQLNLPPVNPSKFDAYGATERQIDLVNWYPQIVPFRGGTWVLHDLWTYGEHLVYDVADYDVYLLMVDQDNPPVVAANAPGVIEGDGTRYQLSNARNFVLSASPDYQISTLDLNGITINSYYFPEHAAAGAMVAYVTQQAMATYSTRFAPYPHSTMTIVENTLYDGMEFDGLYFLSQDFYRNFDGSVLNNLGVIAAHETAHMWWFGLVGNDQAMEPWLDEALSEYSEHIFFEDNYPNWLTWWWGFRVNSKNPAGYVDVTLYNSQSFNIYTRAVYHNGARFLHDLRTRIGDEAFFAALNDYAWSYSGQIAGADDFFRIVRAHTSTDFTDLIDAYFVNTH